MDRRRRRGGGGLEGGPAGERGGQHVLRGVRRDEPDRVAHLSRNVLDISLSRARLARIEPASKDSKVAVLTTGARIPISQTGLARLHAWLGRTGR